MSTTLEIRGSDEKLVLLEYEAEHLIAESWSGFVAELDPETGASSQPELDEVAL